MLSAFRSAGAQEPQVKMLFFYSPTCSHCQAVLSDFMPGIVSKFGSQLLVAYIDITEPANYQNLLRLEEQFGIDSTKAGVPEVFIGTEVLIGEFEVRDRLEGLVRKYIDEGGVGFPLGVEINSAGQPTPDPRATPTAAPTATATPPVRQQTVNVAYFYKTGCNVCARLEYDLRLVSSKFPNMKVTEFEVVDKAPLYEWIAEKLSVPENKRLETPALFIGDHYLIGDDISAAKIEALLDQYAAKGAPAFWDGWDPGDNASSKSIFDRFKAFGGLTVAGAGLVDGLNPCAFATMVFLVSYMALVGRKGREILWIGGAFALGVFATYTLVGLGLLKVAQWIGQLSSLARWVYIGAGALCLVAAALSLSDYVAAKRGKPEEMRLKLPTVWRKQINRVVREGSRRPAFVAVALATGFIVSLIELACTGQIYLPTILYVMSVPAMKPRAVSYLLLYNVLFIVPLVVVFILAYAGTSSQKLGGWINRRTSTVKLLTALVFAALALWLLYAVV